MEAVADGGAGARRRARCAAPQAALARIAARARAVRCCGRARPARRRACAGRPEGAKLLRAGTNQSGAWPRRSPFEDVERAERGDGEPALHRRRRRLRGPARPAAGAGPPPEGRPAPASRSWRSPSSISPSSRQARRMRLELAADYLVMAAWLAYLKSRLLLPEPPKGEEPSGRGARRRRWRSACAGSRRCARRRKRLDERDRLGRDVFARGAPEAGRRSAATPRWEATLYDLLSAYARAAPEAVQRPRRSCRSGMSGRSSRRARRWSG